ncbi:hypothetical protein B0T24DRAFT_618724 [Lasiosphaeria ovina]|uniref:Uncharacterized protein n=1 Tax=Lasiosphaeria ovina TaxID=92902 RepID=A0AAE0KIH3_9PEZI|nr:hypothetical protein B0T24DRAFT_618724 [Lasiosphaeria ovina]
MQNVTSASQPFLTAYSWGFPLELGLLLVLLSPSPHALPTRGASKSKHFQTNRFGLPTLRRPFRCGPHRGFFLLFSRGN